MSDRSSALRFRHLRWPKLLGFLLSFQYQDFHTKQPIIFGLKRRRLNVLAFLPHCRLGFRSRYWVTFGNRSFSLPSVVSDRSLASRFRHLLGFLPSFQYQDFLIKQSSIIFYLKLQNHTVHAIKTKLLVTYRLTDLNIENTASKGASAGLVSAWTNPYELLSSSLWWHSFFNAVKRFVTRRGKCGKSYLKCTNYSLQL